MAQFTVNICQVGRILSKHRCLIMRDFFFIRSRGYPGINLRRKQRQQSWLEIASRLLSFRCVT